MHGVTTAQLILSSNFGGMMVDDDDMKEVDSSSWLLDSLNRWYSSLRRMFHILTTGLLALYFH